MPHVNYNIYIELNNEILYTTTGLYIRGANIQN